MENVSKLEEDTSENIVTNSCTAYQSSDDNLMQAECSKLNNKLDTAPQIKSSIENVYTGNLNEEGFNKEAVQNIGALELNNVGAYTANGKAIDNVPAEGKQILTCNGVDDLVNKTKKKKYLVLTDSDSEEEHLSLASPVNESENEDLSETTLQVKKKRHKQITAIDSDSDMENDITPHNKSFSEDGMNTNEQERSTDLKGVASSTANITPTQKSRWSVLCDPETSDEDDIKGDNQHTNENGSTKDNIREVTLDEEETKGKPYKRKSKSKKGETEKPKQMTGKEAAELRKEIKSESQRMVRERNISLPYHKPKSYTLKEFLARRPKLVVSHASRVPPSIAIKMSKEQLAVISKKLEEREKEVKEFYKSESESENDDEDTDYVPPEGHKETECPKNGVSTSETVEDKDSFLLEEVNKERQSHENFSSTNETVEDNVPLQEENDGSITESVQDENYILPEEDNKEQHQENGDSTRASINIHSLCLPNDAIENKREEPTVIEITQKIRDPFTENSPSAENNLEQNNTEDEEENREVINLEKVDIVNAHDKTLQMSDSLNTDQVGITPGDASILAAEESDTPKTVEETEPCSSMDYEFNLDDLEENSERIIGEESSANDILEKEKSGFVYSDLDREIENFGVGDNEKKPDERFTDNQKLSKLHLIKEKLVNIRPKLSGCPDEVIDLETGVAKPNEVTRLMERFTKHTLNKKHTHKNKVKLSIVSVESGEIHKETVAMNVEDDDASEVEEKPGAKLQKLRDDLQNQLAQMRSEFWQKKATQSLNSEEIDPYKGEKDDCGAEYDILDDEEEEAEMTESSEDEEEDEITEGTQKKRLKSDFIDEEAEESDRENDEINEMANEDEDLKTDSDDEFKEDVQSGLNEDENPKPSDVAEKSEELPVRRTLKRILKGFTEDSDDDEDFDLLSKTVSSKEHSNEKSENVASPDDDYMLPPHQPQSSQTPKRPVTQTQSKSDFEFLTPISYITSIQNLNNSAKKNSPHISPFGAANEPSPLKETNWHNNLQKKLFTETEITDSQLEEVAGLYSGEFPHTQPVDETQTVIEEELANMRREKFPSTLELKENEAQLAESSCEKIPSNVESHEEVLSCEAPLSTQDLLNVCSGGFTGITQNESVGISKPVSENNRETYTFSSNEDIKSLDEDQDLIISQLIDEEEMEKFKKKFESPLLSNTQKMIVEEFEEVVGSGQVIDSGDEDEMLEVKKKRQKKLVFSDDENSEEEYEKDEVIDLHDNIDDSEEEAIISNVDNIDYDSEENEIELVKENARPKPKLADFFEKEAELSGSEWGSDDEDENDLDTMEFEQGDIDKLDEKKIRTDLERIHMRRLLDDDTREVKLLQELLLDDGELHGTGRERQFKWKNIDSLADSANDSEERKDDDVYIEEEESEEQWRKRRHEREMFLKEKLKKSRDTEDDFLNGSQLLKTGHKVIQRSQTYSQSSTPAEDSKAAPSSPVNKQTFGLLNKRGSFLSRSDQVLQRLAEYSRTTSVTLGAATARDSRNFVFQSVSAEKTSVLVVEDKKRKAKDGTPNAIKKLRLSENFSPANRRTKSDKPPSARAKLFGNW